jgi:hypothetical protein
VQQEARSRKGEQPQGRGSGAAITTHPGAAEGGGGHAPPRGPSPFRHRRVSNDTEGGYGTDQSSPTSSRRQSQSVIHLQAMGPGDPARAAFAATPSALKARAAASQARQPAAAGPLPLPPAPAPGFHLSAEELGRAAARLRPPSQRGSPAGSHRGGDVTPPAPGQRSPAMDGVLSAIKGGQYALKKAPPSPGGGGGGGGRAGLSPAQSGVPDLSGPGISAMASKWQQMQQTRVASSLESEF